MRGLDVVVVGGAGHVGAPLAVVLASRGLQTLVYDRNEQAVECILGGGLPFLDEGADDLLRSALTSGHLDATWHPEGISHARYVVLTIGTPVDEFHNPELGAVRECVDGILPYLCSGQTIVLRSTVFPGVTEWLARYLSSRLPVAVAFCPERVVQGRAVEELQTLPQIVSGTTQLAEDAAAELFERIAPRVIRMRPREAEYAKLVCNAYRYLQFAATNQFCAMVESDGCSYARVLAGLRDGYPRADIPLPGFAAGPCLHKDTLQLIASGDFDLGHAAIRANEGMAAFVVDRLRHLCDLPDSVVGILGAAFKPDSDDPRSSLSYKLRKLLEFHAKRVLMTDPHVTDSSLLPFGEVVERSDVLVLAVRHRAYEGVDLSGKPVFDFHAER